MQTPYSRRYDGGVHKRLQATQISQICTGLKRLSHVATSAHNGGSRALHVNHVLTVRDTAECRHSQHVGASVSMAAVKNLT